MLDNNGTPNNPADDRIIFAPTPDFNGTATVEYTVADSNGDTSTATLSIPVTSVNDPPVDENDSVTTLEDTPATGNVLTNGSDANGGPIVSNQVVSGTMSGIADLDAYTFTGTFGQRVLVAAVATSGVGFNTNISLYPPTGGPPPTYTSADRLDFQLTSTGTWTIVIEDFCSLPRRP